MNVLFVGDNICGIPNALARALREEGHEATTLSFNPDSQGHVSDILTLTSSRFERVLIILSRKEDVFFFVGDTPVGGIDILFYKLMGKKVIIEYHGSEVRGKGPRFFHRFADALFVSTPDLLDDVPGGIWLPNPIFVKDYPVAEPEGTVIAHATTDRFYSGTAYLVEAVGRLLNRMPEVRLNIIEGVSYEEAISSYRKATFMVDKLITVGYPGMSGLECMAMGIPVVCYVRRELKEQLKGAVCFTTPHHIERDLFELLNCKRYRELHSIYGKEYVAAVHNPKECVKKIMDAIA